MTLASQGLLGGIVYLTISAACPIAGALFTSTSARPVLIGSIAANNCFLVLFALTPTRWGSLSTTIFIASRAAVGFTQSFLCIYSPLFGQLFGVSCCQLGNYLASTWLLFWIQMVGSRSAIDILFFVRIFFSHIVFVYNCSYCCYSYMCYVCE